MKKINVIIFLFIILFMIFTCSEPSENNSFSSKSLKTEEIVNVSGVVLDKTNILMYIGWSDQLEVSVLPSNATNQTIKWSSNDDTVAEVSQEGEVTAKAAGETVITATTVDGSFSANCLVKVVVEYIRVTGVELNKTTTTIRPGDTEQLVVTVLPSNATNKNVTWSSNNNTIVNITSEGLITTTAGLYGGAKITVTTGDGGYTVSCNVTAVYQIGNIGPAGGTIFYDKGNNNNGWRFLEAAPCNQETSIPWANSDDNVLNGDDESIGTGLSNTNKIVGKYGSSNKYAAGLCYGLTLGGYSDWFLPSIYELAEMYKCKNYINNNGEPLSNGYYLSSSEHNFNHADARSFSNGSHETLLKHLNRNVRAIRRF